MRGQTTATLLVDDPASVLEIKLVALPDRLYRISTPPDSGLAPRVTDVAGTVRLDLGATGESGPDSVRILLNRKVRWDLRLPAGAGEQHLDLAAGHLRRLDIGSGAGLIRLRLPGLATIPPVTSFAPALMAPERTFVLPRAEGRSRAAAPAAHLLERTFVLPVGERGTREMAAFDQLRERTFVLGKARRIVPIRVTGSVGELVVSVPPGTGFRLRLRGGAGSVAAPGVAPGPAGRGSVVSSTGGRIPDRHYEIDVGSTVGELVVRH
ncbi:hypothetical protein [Actinoplanes sp. NPDC051494]|uniref:hypothetical protein n=1 Tax=Actinoplanes sp. NPDC051494 TaxID=3363907 RepID=UPI0037BD641E